MSDLNLEHSAWANQTQNDINKKFNEPVSGGGSWLKKIGIIIFSALILSAAVGYYIYSKPQNPDISLNFGNVGRVNQGQPFVVTVSYSNNSDKVLSDAKISLLVPEGVSFLGAPLDQRVDEEALGDIGPGSISSRDFKVIVTNGTLTIKHLESRIKYQLSGRTFDNNASYDVSVDQPAVGISFSAPDKIYPGQNFDMSLTYQNNTSQDLTNLSLAAVYPDNFRFIKSSSTPDSGNNSWNIPFLAKNSSGTIAITGSMNDVGRNSSNFQASISSNISGQTYALGSQSSDLSIAAAPLMISLVANDDPNYAAKAGDTLRYTLTYKNNASVPMANVNISASLSGQMFDLSSLRSDGFFNSLNNSVSWNPSNKGELSSLAPGQQGSVTFDISIKPNFPIQRMGDKNYTVRVKGTIISPTVPPDVSASNTVSVTSLETKIAGKLTFKQSAFFYDASSGILNNGPYPPKANKTTKYTIHWNLVNYSTDMSDINISAILQPGTRYAGVFKGNTNVSPVYDQNSGRISWSLKGIQATKGVISQPAELIFQVENTPSSGQIGQSVALISDAQLSATDSFTGQTFTLSSPQVNTDLQDDIRAFSTNNKQVQP